ncbi:hypothetical protein [Natronorubrum sp. DTA7]|uniref:hypothetical protein n=1 Tax=Natronorubrum sp. DTA7 TaxID=3447016 RepID=UPI003F841E2C
MSSSNPEQQIIEGMEDLVEDARGGAVVDLLPKRTNETVAIGLSVAVDALHDQNEEVAKAALEIAANELEGRSLHADMEQPDGDLDE